MNSELMTNGFLFAVAIGSFLFQGTICFLINWVCSLRKIRFWKFLAHATLYNLFLSSARIWKPVILCQWFVLYVSIYTSISILLNKEIQIKNCNAKAYFKKSINQAINQWMKKKAKTTQWKELQSHTDKERNFCWRRNLMFSVLFHRQRPVIVNQPWELELECKSPQLKESEILNACSPVL